MFQKFASATVIDVKSAPSRVRSASLSKFADFNEYRTDDGYLYVRVRAISSRINKNNDGWPSEELQKAYRTFIGKPIFVDHHNSDPSKARGVIVDAALHVEDQHTAALDPYYASAPENHLPPTWIELLLEVDADKFPKLAKAIINGEIDGVSMGCNVELSKCSHCGNEARSPEDYCKHVQSKGAYFDYYTPQGTKVAKKSYEDCYDIGFFEISFVFDPADETALVNDIKHSSVKMERIAAIRAEADTKTANAPSWFLQAAEAAGVLGVSGLTAATAMQVGYLWNRYRQIMGSNPKPIQTVVEAIRTLPDLVDPHSTMQPESFDRMSKAASTKTAEGNPKPQSELTTRPDKVDTLRQEQTCPICGSTMEDGVCAVCNYEEPPEGFQNPDLDKAKKVDEQIEQQQAQQAAGQPQSPPAPTDVQPGPSNGPAPLPSGAMPATSKWQVAAAVSIEKTSANGRINTQERPILPVKRQLSDKPINPKTVAQATQPVQSNVKDNMTDITKTADGATALGEGVQAEKRVDVEGVGAVSGDPLKGIEHENVEKDTGDFVAPHTDTWSDGEGDSLGQQDPVTSETGDFFTVSSEKTAADAEDNAGDDASEGLGSAKEGIPTWDTSAAGIPDHDPARIDLNAPLKEEVGDRTKTFGSDDFHITEPVTKGDNANNLGGPIGVAVASAKARQFKAFQLVDAEIDLGITKKDDKFTRAAALEDESEEALDAQLATLARVKEAGYSKKQKTASTKKTAGAGRMPSFKPVTAAFEIEAHGVSDQEIEDSLW